jgi:hypothetical protein
LYTFLPFFLLAFDVNGQTNLIFVCLCNLLCPALGLYCEVAQAYNATYNTIQCNTNGFFFSIPQIAEPHRQRNRAFFTSSRSRGHSDC